MEQEKNKFTNVALKSEENVFLKRYQNMRRGNVPNCKFLPIIL